MNEPDDNTAIRNLVDILHHAQKTGTALWTAAFALHYLQLLSPEHVHAGSRTEIKRRGDAKAVNGPTLPRSKVGRVGHPENQGQNRAVVKGGPPARSDYNSRLC